ncbi:MAG TPA: hypothetical protein VLX92_11240 [Kofleriaceae bacterium]|nr:hypothetical protein [Kofleriaceae bacterium]
MRHLALVLAAACGTTSYKIPGTELQRLAMVPPEQRGQHVRVVQLLHDADVGPPEPVTAETQIVFFPQIDVYGPERRRYYSYGGGGGGNFHVTGGHGGGGHGWGLHGGGGGGDGKAEAVVILVAAAIVLVAAAAVEGSRYDGYAQLHPMHPVHLFGKDGSYTVLPLAWIDPQTAAWADHGVVRSTEGPWRELGRAPLDRAGWSYAMFGGVGTYRSADGSKAPGTATTIQLGYFPEQHVGVLTSLFFGWRDDAVQNVLFETRYTVEVDGYPVQVGPLHLGLYGGGGGASRWEDYPGVPGGGNDSSLALIGGALLQLDINTRLAITARLGETYAHDERMSDAMIGLSVY